MCTIGNSFYQMDGQNIQSVFKQCDLTSATTFLTPVVQTAASQNSDPNTPKNIRYVAFTRKRGSETPAWSGVNEYGVSFVAADSYLSKNETRADLFGVPGTESVFDMYLRIITSYTTARDAVMMAKKFYETVNYGDPLTDILLISDEKEMYFIETVNKTVRIIQRSTGHFVSTNHCRMFYETVPYEQNHSTYLRLDRAEKILQNRPDINGIGNLLRDSYYGKTVWSICRYASLTGIDDASAATQDQPQTEEELFYTQAAVVFTVKPRLKPDEKPQIICEYVINANASVKGAGYVWKPFENEDPVQVNYIACRENII